MPARRSCRRSSRRTGRRERIPRLISCGMRLGGGAEGPSRARSYARSGTGPRQLQPATPAASPRPPRWLEMVRPHALQRLPVAEKATRSSDADPADRLAGERVDRGLNPAFGMHDRLDLVVVREKVSQRAAENRYAHSRRFADQVGTGERRQASAAAPFVSCLGARRPLGWHALQTALRTSLPAGKQGRRDPDRQAEHRCPNCDRNRSEKARKQGSNDRQRGEHGHGHPGGSRISLAP